MEKKHNEKVSQELKEEKEKQKNQRKMAKDLHNAMQNANDSLIKSQHNIRNKLEGISHFALDQYIQKLAFGVIAPPTSNEDSDQSPLKVRSRNPRLGSNNYMSLYFMTIHFSGGRGPVLTEHVGSGDGLFTLGTTNCKTFLPLAENYLRRRLPRFSEDA